MWVTDFSLSVSSFQFIYKVWHFFFVVYDGMTAAQGHSQPFRHPDGCPVFRSDTATDGFQSLFSKGVFQTSTGGFCTVTVMPICVIEYISKLDSLVSVYGTFHQTGLPYQRTVFFLYDGKISKSVLTVSGELPVYPLAHILLVKPCSQAYMTSGFSIMARSASISFRVILRISSRSVSMMTSDAE